MKPKIVVAWAERCSGPGWSNPVIWYIERESDGTLRQYSAQRDEWSHSMSSLFSVCAAASDELTDAVNAWAGKRT